jgi:hypothetical protein
MAEVADRLPPIFWRIDKHRTFDSLFMPEVNADPTDPTSCLRPSQAHLAAAFLFLYWPALCFCQTQSRSILCRDGNANYEAEFQTGIRVEIGASHPGGPSTLATRTCEATLIWQGLKHEKILVASNTSELDLDVFGVDFGDGIPSSAFQIKQTEAGCCAEYRIYSIEKPPRLVRTIIGGEFFTASDRDLEGRIEIWTNDGAAANGFEKLSLGELDSAPTVVFRFAHGKLLDASSEFKQYFDDEIAARRTEFRAEDLEAFKNSDGMLANAPTAQSGDALHKLRSTKIKVLEIVWAYLYSGREADAWRSLSEMWPAADVDRIRAALAKMHAQGICRQADGLSMSPKGKKKKAPIFDAVARTPGTRKLEVIPPRAILLERPLDAGIQASWSESMLDLIIDSAGKVRTAQAASKGQSVPAAWVKAALAWKFIPAVKDGKPVASRLRIAVSPKQ